MKFVMPLALALLLIGPAFADDAAEPAPEAVPRMVITKPIPDSDLQPVPVPRAQTPADKALQDEAAQTLKQQAEDLSDTCDTPITARIDWTAIDPNEINHNSTANACGPALDAVAEACRTSGAQRLVAAEIREIICTAGPTAAVDLHGGTMVYTLDWQSRNPAAFVYSYLMNHL